MQKTALRIKNTSDIPTEVIRDVIRFVRPPGIKGFLFKVTKNSRCLRGWAWNDGSGATIRVNAAAKYPRTLKPYQYGQLTGRRYYLSSLLEAVIYITAHELVHVRQAQKGKLRGRVWGARGRFSEVETEAYAIRKLREWRRSQ